MQHNKMQPSQEVLVQPDPPIVGRVTYHTVDLYWPTYHEDDTTSTTTSTTTTSTTTSSTTGGSAGIIYCIQEEDVERNSSYVTVYEGPDSHCTCTGLSPSNKYQYRLKITSGKGCISPWSQSVTVSTTRYNVTCDNLHKAIASNDVDKVKSILELNPQYLDIPDSRNLSPLMNASKMGRSRIVELLLNLGANVEFSNSSGKTSLIEACYHGSNDCVMLLRNAGASWHHRDASGFSVLHWAVDGEHLETVELLLKEGFPVDDVHEAIVPGWSPLIRLAATHGNVNIARVLIQYGADCNMKDNQGQTPLMYACLGGHFELVNLLLCNGCDYQVKNKYNKTALDFAISFGRENIVTLLNSVKTKSPIHMK